MIIRFHIFELFKLVANSNVDFLKIVDCAITSKNTHNVRIRVDFGKHTDFRLSFVHFKLISFVFIQQKSLQTFIYNTKSCKHHYNENLSRRFRLFSCSQYFIDFFNLTPQIIWQRVYQRCRITLFDKVILHTHLEIDHVFFNLIHLWYWILLSVYLPSYIAVIADAYVKSYFLCRSKVTKLVLFYDCKRDCHSIFN